MGAALDRKCSNADGTPKRRFLTMESALAIGRHLNEIARKGRQARAYGCPACGFFHVGHSDARRRDVKAVSRDEMVALQLPRCAGIARNQTRSRPWDRDEAEAVAVGAINEALITFDALRGKGTYKARWRRHADKVSGDRVRDYLRGVKRRPTVPLTEYAVESASSPAALDPDREPYVGWSAEYEEWVRALSRRLPPRHGEALRARYLHADASTGEGLAARLGVQVARADQLHRQAVEMLRVRYADAESWRQLVDAIRHTARRTA